MKRFSIRGQRRLRWRLSAGSAIAADLPSRKEAPVYVPPPPPPPMWTGFYVGLNIGGGWSANSSNNSYLPYADTTYGIGSIPFPGASPNLFFLPGGGQTNNNTGGVVGGGQVGYNFQFNQFVIGAEADIQGTSITGGNQGNYAGLYTSPYPRSSHGPALASRDRQWRQSWSAVVRHRSRPRRLSHHSHPAALWHGRLRLRRRGSVPAHRHLHRLDGWRRRRVAVRPALVGEGRISLCRPRPAAEINGAIHRLAGGHNHHPQLNVVRVGVNYHFNFAAPAPVVAKY